jgi:hypothetical protein
VAAHCAVVQRRELSPHTGGPFKRCAIAMAPTTIERGKDCILEITTAG